MRRALCNLPSSKGEQAILSIYRLLANASFEGDRRWRRALACCQTFIFEPSESLEIVRRFITFFEIRLTLPLRHGQVHSRYDLTTDLAYLLSPSVGDELGEKHLCFFVREVIEHFDMSVFEQSYSWEDGELYAPQLMLAYGFMPTRMASSPARR